MWPISYKTLSREKMFTWRTLFTTGLAVTQVYIYIFYVQTDNADDSKLAIFWDH